MPRVRNPMQTRRAILQAAYENIHRQGYQAAGLSDILAATGVTKGALYHHFPNKAALGYAVVDEVLKAYVETWWLEPIEDTEDPIGVLAGLIDIDVHTDLESLIELGCPLDNLAQEMSAIDDGFRQRIEGLYRLWRKGIESSLRKSQQRGDVLGDVDADQAAVFFIAAVEGGFGQAKAAQSNDVFRDCMVGLRRYLLTLRA